MATETAFNRDPNFVPITTLGLIEDKTITYLASTTGAIGATTLFTVTGTVALKVYGFCTTDLAGSGTIEVGTATSTASVCDQQSATAIDNHELWNSNVLAIGGQIGDWTIVNEDIIQTIASNTVTAGVLNFYCNWAPLSSDGNVTTS